MSNVLAARAEIEKTAKYLFSGTSGNSPGVLVRSLGLATVMVIASSSFSVNETGSPNADAREVGSSSGSSVASGAVGVVAGGAGAELATLGAGAAADFSTSPPQPDRANASIETAVTRVPR